MEFLYKLYSNNYFGIGLFIVITILAFAFLVILFFGKKDEKARIAEEKEKELQQQKEELEDKTVEEPSIEMATLEPIILEEKQVLESTNAEEELKENPVEESIFNKEIILEETNVEKPNEESLYFEETPKEEMDPFVTSNIVLNTDYIADEDSKEQEDLSQSSDIYNLNSLIKEDEIENNEEESIDDVLNKYDAIEETILDESTRNAPVEDNTPIVEENDFVDINTSDDSIKKTTTPFSSVYLTKEEADINTEDIIEEPKPTIPNRTAFEMPKRVDLPKRSANTIKESIISSLREEKENEE